MPPMTPSAMIMQKLEEAMNMCKEHGTEIEIFKILAAIQFAHTVNELPVLINHVRPYVENALSEKKQND